jgi:parallel beta-helix repeat protein
MNKIKQSTNKLLTITFVGLLVFVSFTSLIAITSADNTTKWTDIKLPYTISQPGQYRINETYVVTDLNKALTVEADNVVVDGQNNIITIQNQNTAVKSSVIYAVNHSNLTLANIKIIDTTTNSSNKAFQFGNCTDVTFTGCTAANCYDGFDIRNLTRGRIDSCNLDECSFGMYLYNITNFQATSCTITNASTDGIDVYYSSNLSLKQVNVENAGGFGIGMWYSNNLTVSNCIVKDCVSYITGLLVYGDDNCLVKDCTFENNAEGCMVGFSNCTFTNNKAVGNGLMAPEFGAGFLSCNSNCTVTDNTFENNYDAVAWQVNGYDPHWEAVDNPFSGTCIVKNNIFQNNTYTFNFDYELPNSIGPQKLIFSNNLVNDSSYVDPLGFKGDYSGNYLPLNSTIISLNSTAIYGQRIYGVGSRIGGNFWAHPNGTGPSQTGTDANRDGVIDTKVTLFGNTSIGSIYDYLPLSTNYSSNLTFTAGAAQTVTTSQLSGVVNVSRIDAFGAVAAVTINLASSSSGGTFYSDAAGTKQVTNITMAANATTASFYYKDTIKGTPVITVTSLNANQTQTTFTINDLPSPSPTPTTTTPSTTPTPTPTSTPTITPTSTPTSTPQNTIQATDNESTGTTIDTPWLQITVAIAAVVIALVAAALVLSRRKNKAAKAAA